MKNGQIDLVITGADRIAKNYDFANKIGTYEKAVIAKENGIPFYVAAPLSTFDKKILTGDEIVIEERDKQELYNINGKNIMPKWIKIKNPAFDITPNKYVTGFITENGIKKIN
jgi:translation initiation factor eIF-2B subunit alpha/methylthioribose-1-phosphate isomerase